MEHDLTGFNHQTSTTLLVVYVRNCAKMALHWELILNYPAVGVGKTLTRLRLDLGPDSVVYFLVV